MRFTPTNNNSEYDNKQLNLQWILFFVAFYLLSAVLLFSGITKKNDPLPLLNTLKQITFLPTELQIIIATLLPVVEIGLALLMVTKTKPKLTLPIVTAMLGLFLVFSIYGTVAGYGADYGCFGDVVKSSFGWGMILRNAVFFILSLIINFIAWPSKINNNK